MNATLAHVALRRARRVATTRRSAALRLAAMLAVAPACWRARESVPADPPHPPPARAHHQLVYHAREERVYLVGGSTRHDSGYHYFHDLWSWKETRWTPVDTLPFRRSSHRVVYHAARNSIVLFGGGADRAFAADAALWEWRGRGWRRVGASPAGGRAEPGLCYDAARQRIVAFGGWDGGNQYSDVLWEWTGAGEAVIVTDARGPSGRAGHAFLYDARRQRCLLFGGRGEAGYLADTWEWDGVEWRRHDAPGPSPRWFFGAATDYANRRIVLFGGSGPAGDHADTWTWDGERWQRLAGDGGPVPRGMARLAFDGSAVLLFGGRSPASGGFRDHNDTWRLQGGVWHQLR